MNNYKQIEKRLTSQISRAELILFTGAGFSVGAKNFDGESLPLSKGLRSSIWQACFAAEELDDDSSLSEVFQAALNRDKTALRNVLNRHLKVDPESLPAYYEELFSLPWRRIYTLNIDDLPDAVSLRFSLPRPIRTLSATEEEQQPVFSGFQDAEYLQVIHLNGRISQEVEKLTFGEIQYGRRLINFDQYYQQLVADLVSYPFVFIGTEISEQSLWYHIELRSRQKGVKRHPPRRSVLVTPSLRCARRVILEDLRLDWLPYSVEQFAKEFLPCIASGAARGRIFLDDKGRLVDPTRLITVSILAAQNPSLDTDYFFGAEPHWSDIIQGRAAKRAIDDVLYSDAVSALQSAEATALVITGTAGTGKSTSLMRLALRLTDDGYLVYWTSADESASPHTIREALKNSRQDAVIMVDDFDTYGDLIGSIIASSCASRSTIFFAIAARSSRVGRFLDEFKGIPNVKIVERAVPNLEDHDIDGIIEVLDQYNRLGELKNASPEMRISVFRRKCGRQLLVAMIEATSGRDHKEKAIGELNDLNGIERELYSIVCVASSIRHYLRRSEIALAFSDSPSEAVTALSQLVGRHLLRSYPPHYHYKARHRTLAEIVFDELVLGGELAVVLSRLVWAVVCSLPAQGNHSDRIWRLFVYIINHDFLTKYLELDDARKLYSSIEEMVKNEHHYWLQRGSLEVERGALDRAENFLSQARSLQPDDYRIETEYGYLMLRQAREPSGGSRARADQGIEHLIRLAERHGSKTPYPFHVLGTQGRLWADGAGLAREERAEYLERFLFVVKRGTELHPRHLGLQDVEEELRRAILMTTVKR